ncbi:hypothetical protein AYO22_10941 [Fonsecaea multimorphosa]|nr:hypothetical protein AYO22_10941 [Fonsecaea multimorphosa]
MSILLSSLQLPQPATEGNQSLDPKNTCRVFQNHQPGNAEAVWQQDYEDETRDVVSTSTTLEARNATTQPQFTAEANNFEPMPLMIDYLSDMSFSAFGDPSQRPSAVPVEESVMTSKAVATQGPEIDQFSMDMMSPDMEYWDVSPSFDALYQDLGLNFGFARSIDLAQSTQHETPGSEPDLGANIASPPAPSFLDARASPEPCEGQGLTYDDYVRKVFANRRHLHSKDKQGSHGHTLEKAHIPPVIGDFPLSLSSQSDDSTWEPENLRHVPSLTQEVYDQIVAAFQQLNATQCSYIQFAGGAFPSLAACNAFMQLYFEEFNPLFPFLHQPTFNPSTTPWLLVLATISIGIRFARDPAAVECGDIMQEFLRRAFLATIEEDYSSFCEPWLAQAGLLNQIGMQFSKDMRLFQYAQSVRSIVTSICRQVNCFHEMRRPAPLENNKQSAEDAWKIWLRRESMRRLAYTLWVVDSQALLFFDLPPLVPMKLLQVRLPCHESLWHAPTASSWVECYKQNRPYLPLSIREELNNLYRTHVRQQGLGDYAILVLILGVFRNAAEVRRVLDEGCHLLPYFAQSKTQPAPVSYTRAETFPTIHKAMEYLRVLCPADEEVPRLSSLKSAILLHYHAVGILLRIPLGELYCYCGYRVTSTDIAHCEARLKVWAQQHGEEVRQVALHASRLFAHIRRSNLHYHYEGRMMLISCQALWIYTATAQSSLSLGGHKDQTEHPSGHGLSSSIRLDQGLTREAVEAWIRNGQQMVPCLAGVGSLQGVQGIARLIQEGSRIMMAASRWPLNIAQGRCLRIYHQLRSGSPATDVEPRTLPYPKAIP